MTRKHFKELAERLQESKPLDKTSAMRAQWNIDVLGMTSFCQSQNVRFDRAKFLTACGYYDD